MFKQDAKKIEIIKQHVKSYPDFPKKGVLFRDIFSVLAEPNVYSLLREVVVNYAKKITPPIECVVALESRGFLIGPLVSLELKVPFVAVRKKGKLPGKVVGQKYNLEYGEDEFEIQVESVRKNMRVLIVDDLLATGGSLRAACELVRKCEAEVVSCLVVMEILDLQGKSSVPGTVHSVIQF